MDKKWSGNSVSSSSLRRSFAFFLMLVVTFAFLSPFTLHLYLVGKGLFFIGGLPLVWLGLPLLFTLALLTLIKGEFPQYGHRLGIGFSLVIVGLMVILSHISFSGEENFSYELFHQNFNSVSFNSEYFFSNSIGGGYLGFLLSSILNLGGVALVYFVGTVLIVGGFFVIFYPYLKKGFISARSHLAIARSKNALEKKKKQEEEDNKAKLEAKMRLAPIENHLPNNPFEIPSLGNVDPLFGDSFGNDCHFGQEKVTEKRSQIYHQEENALASKAESTNIDFKNSISRGSLSFDNANYGSSNGLMEATFFSSSDSFVSSKSVSSSSSSLESSQNFAKSDDFSNPDKMNYEPSFNEQSPSEDYFEKYGNSNDSNDLELSNAKKESEIDETNENDFGQIHENNSFFVEAPQTVSSDTRTISSDSNEGFPNVDNINENVPASSFSTSHEEVKTENNFSQNNVADKALATSSREEDLLQSQTESSLINESISPEEVSPFLEPIKTDPKPFKPMVDPTTGEPYRKPLPNYILPDASLLNPLKEQDEEIIAKQKEEAEQRMEIINNTLTDFSAGARVVSYTIGPSVTRFNIQTDRGVMISKISSYLQNISAALQGVPVRFEEIIQGQTTSGLEVANTYRRTVTMKEVFEALPPLDKKSRFAIPFGQSIDGKYYSGCLNKFPHMLVSGGTGSGKSVFMQSVIMSLIMRNRPDELKLVMVDPKRVEMACYDKIPHLLCPIIKDMNQAKVCIDKLCHEMERRYSLFEKAGYREINEYNDNYADEKNLVRLPYIVCIIDEFADLMDTNKNVLEPVIRLAQKARAAGISLIIATQRPTVDVVSGRLKANLGVRVALAMQSQVDSQTIINKAGAEELAGYGDMLAICPEVIRSSIFRAQGAFVETKEISKITKFIRDQSGPQYDPFFLDLIDHEAEEKALEAEKAANAPSREELKEMADDELYQAIKETVINQEYFSVSRIQREFNSGFNRANKMFARLQSDGIVAPSDPNNPSNSRGCKVLIHDLGTLVNK